MGGSRPGPRQAAGQPGPHPRVRVAAHPAGAVHGASRRRGAAAVRAGDAGSSGEGAGAVSNLFEDHVAAFTALITGAGLTVYRGKVTGTPPAQYVLVYSYFETPDGLAAPDAVSLVLDSD